MSKKIFNRVGAGLISAVCLALIGGEAAHRVVHGHGRWRERARALYSQYKGALALDARAAEVHPAAPTQASVSVTVDVRADRHAISPYIYGLAHAPAEDIRDLRAGSHRWGGNPNTRYNWVAGAWNSARDWEWRNTGGPGPHKPSEAADGFVRASKQAGAAALMTVPTMGWIARDGDNMHQSRGVPADGGPPLTAADGAIAGYDPTENRARTSVRSAARKGRPFTDSPTPADGVVYQDEWIHHLVKTFGDAAHGGVAFYAMDNEPDLWSSTHTDVHPARMGYDDVLANFLEYATALKAVDPAAQVTGPVSWGWTGYSYSALDKGNDNYHTHADSTRHGGGPFLSWFLKQVRAHDIKTGRRTLDVLDVHYYPQGHGLYAGQRDEDAKARRLRATRSLWDSAYADESWIGEPVRLIPRLRAWISEGYPGTRIGITEWNFGADADMNGALAIAEVLGIFGREGVYLANYWTRPAKGSPGYLAFKLYRNVDGQGHGFGNLSCRATSTNADQVSCFAATDASTGDLTLLLVNKMPGATVKAPIIFKGGWAAGGMAGTWRLSADKPKVIQAHAGPRIQGGSMVLSLPPYSATLVRLAPGKDPE